MNPKFSKRHFKAIADVIAHSTAQNKYEVAQDLAKMFQDDNPRFDYARFYRAVGITTLKRLEKLI